MAIRGTQRVCIGLLSLVFLVNARVAASGSSWFARVWQVDDGLPGDNVTGMAQDRDGYLWIATQSGLAKFDGVRIQPVPIPVGRPYPIIRAMLRDRSGALWLAEEGGVLVEMGAGTVTMLTATNGLSRGQALEIAQAGDGAVWISYADGQVCRILGNRVAAFGETEGLPASGTCSLASGRDGGLWFAKGGNVGVFREGRFKTLVTLGERNIQVKPALDKGAWICAGDRILKFEEGTGVEELGRLTADAAAARATALLEDNNRALWIGTSANGLFRYFGTNIQRIETSHGRIRGINEDREGNIWVGTDGGGLNRVRPQVVELQGKDAGLPFDTVRSVCEDASGTIWVVMQDGAVSRLEDEGWNTVSSTDAWPGGQATCVASDGKGVVWLGTYSHGLYCFKEGKFSVLRRRDGLASASIRALLADSSGSLWVAFSTDTTLQRLRDGAFKNYALPEGSKAVRAMCEDSSGNIWMANLDKQLLRVEGDKVVEETGRTVNPAQTFDPVRPIRCLAGARDGSLWIGYSAAGVGRLKDGKFLSIGREQGLKDESICSMMADNLGWVWFGSDHGILRVRTQELEEVAEGRAQQLRTIRYGRDDGLPSLQGYYGYAPGAAKCRDGRILIPTHSGLVIAHPDRIQANRLAPPVVIEQVLADEREIRKKQARDGGESPNPGSGGQGNRSRVVLEPGHRKVEFVFTAPTFIEPTSIVFRYRLEGWDARWVEAGDQRTAVYPRLPAGDYEFSVKAGNSEGIWNNTGASFGFSVKPFFWQTWWFRGPAAMLFTGGIFTAARYISLRRLKAKLRRLEQASALQEERARIAQDIHDDLGARMTQISLLAELTKQNLKKPEKAEEHVSEIASMSRQGIKALDEIVWAVNPRNDTLPDLLDYAGQYAVDFLAAAGIRCRVDFPATLPTRDITAEMRHSLFLAVKEAFHNAAKHSKATEVQLRVTVSDTVLKWEIEDNGRGFEHETEDGKADGLRNMRKRLAELGGTCSIEGRAGAGTRIRFEVPWRNGLKRDA